MQVRRVIATTAAVSGIAVPVGVAVVAAPVVAAAVSGTVILASILATLHTSRAARVYLVLLAALLLGYMFLGRSFAYFGLGSVYVGEAVLAVGVLTVALRRSWSRLRSPRVMPVIAALMLFVAWGVVTTVPHFGRYRLVSLRDAAIWGYAVFAVLVLLLRKGIVLGVTLRAYKSAILVFLVWVALTQTAEVTGLADIGLKPGDIAVHLAGAGVFLMLGLHRDDRAGPRGWHQWMDTAVWMLWFGCFLLVAVRSRGGGLAVLVTLSIVAAIDRSRRIVKPIAIGLAVLLLVMQLDIRVRGDQGREVSTSQLAINFSSIVRQSDDATLIGTKNWRLAWWDRIVSYTVHGPYFWTGKGYGVNLADDDGFQATADRSLRSPHNINFTILARSGVPGLAFWILLQLTFAGSLLAARRWADREGDKRIATAILWVLGLWLAMLVNATFDVYLEGPQGAIWFWSVVGLGVVLACDPAATTGDQGGRHPKRPADNRDSLDDLAIGNDGGARTTLLLDVRAQRETFR